MTSLARREGFFEDLFGFRREFDELFNRLLSETPWETERTRLSQRDVP